jgi:hypothetical protein
VNILINIVIAVGLLGASLFGLATAVAIGAWGVLAGLYNAVNAYRLRARIGINIAIFCVMVYLGVHVLIAYFDPRYFSFATSLWTLGFSGVFALGIWMFGGMLLDSTIVIANLSNADFARLMQILGEQEIFTPKPNLLHPLQRLAYDIRQVVKVGGAPLRAALVLWRRFGRGFLDFLKTMFMIAQLIGMYFLYFPPSNNWRLFFATAVAFTGFFISGIGFNWRLWRQVCIASMLFNTAISTLAALLPNTLQGPAGISSLLFGTIFSREVLLTVAFFALVVLFATRGKSAASTSTSTHHS